MHPTRSQLSRRNTTWLLLLLCLAAAPAHSQLYQTTTYNEWDGMPTNTVYDAAQDSLGIMWFATRMGLATYDGRDWKTEAFPPTGPGQVKVKLKTDDQGGLWAVAARPCLSISQRHRDHWQTYSYPDSTDNNMGIVGLEIMDQEKEPPRIAIVTYQGKIIISDRNHWQTIVSTDQAGHFHASALLGSDLFLAGNQGLFHLAIDAPAPVVKPMKGFPPGPVTHLAVDPNNHSLWVVGQNWLGVWDGKNLKILARGLNMIAPKTGFGTVALADNSGGLIFGSQFAIYYFHPRAGLENMTSTNGLIADGASAIFQDRESNIWITSTRGISKMTNRRFVGFNRTSGLLTDEVSAILQMRDGRIVCGHEGGLTFLEEKPRRLAFPGPNKVLSRVMDLAQDQAGNLWFAANRRGLGKLSAGEKLEWYTEADGLPGTVFALYFDPRGTLWIGTSRGLFRLRGKSFEQIPLPLDDPQRSSMIRRLVGDPEGGFFLAVPHEGLLHFADGKFSFIRPAKGSEGRNTYNCYVDRDHTVWVGSGDGLFRVVGDQLVRANTPGPAIDRPVYAIIRDDQGLLWFGTDLGVYRWNGSHLDHLTIKDGLLGNETNRSALLQSRDGGVWIGTESGASLYRRIFDIPPTDVPHLQITGYKIDGQLFPAGKDLVLSEPPHTLEVLYRGLSFVDETRMRYRTRLLGFESKWHETSATGSNSTNYIHLPPGHYRFNIQAIRIDGATSPVAASSRITVKPSPLDRWYWRSFLALLAVGIVWVVFALVSGRQYTHRLENEVSHQTRELKLSEKSIKSESRRLAATLKSIADGVLAVSAGGTIILANSAALKILGRPDDEVVGRPLGQVLPSLEPSPKDNLLQLGHPWKEGRFLEVSSTLIADGGEAHGQVVAFRDITDRLRQDDERIRSQKLESLGVFAGGLAHDFNNLLTVMLGNLSLVESSSEIPPDDLQLLGMVKEASLRAQNLTRQLLTFARGGEPLLETASIGKLVRQAVKFSLSGTNVSCQLDVPGNLWPVRVDPGQMDQVLTNLVLNAVQAMPDGGTIKVTGHNIGSQDQRTVLVEIADEGLGIPQENLSRIFDPYFTTKELGSGLGLAMVYSIINRHHGHITVESKPGEGTVFRIFLKASPEG